MIAPEPDKNRKKKSAKKKGKKSTWRKLVEYARFEPFKFIMEPGISKFAQIFWTLNLVLAYLVTGFFLGQIFQKIDEAPVLVTSQPYETKVSDIPASNLAICSTNIFRKFQYELLDKILSSPNEDGQYVWKHENGEIIYEVGELEDLKCIVKYQCRASASPGMTNGHLFPKDEQFCDMKIYEETDPVYQQKIKPFLMAGVQSCDQLLKVCYWDGTKYKCSFLFTLVKTDVGYCCVLNFPHPENIIRASDADKDGHSMYWDYTTYRLIEPEFINGTWRNKHGLFYQSKVGSRLKVVLAYEINEQFCSSDESDGFWVSSGSPDEFPTVRDKGVVIAPGKSVKMKLKAALVSSKANIKNLELEIRKSYYPGEKRLRNFKVYTMGNCKSECVANETFADCKCYDHNMPQPPGQLLCSAEMAECVDGARRKVNNANGQNDICNCLPSAFELSFEGSPTTSVLRKSALENLNFTKLPNETYTLFEVGMESEGVTTQVRANAYEWSDIIAQIFGTLGLLGLSQTGIVRIICAILQGIFALIMFLIVKSFKVKKGPVEPLEPSDSIPMPNVPNQIIPIPDIFNPDPPMPDVAIPDPPIPDVPNTNLPLPGVSNRITPIPDEPNYDPPAPAISTPGSPNSGEIVPESEDTSNLDSWILEILESDEDLDEVPFPNSEQQVEGHSVNDGQRDDFYEEM